MRFKSFAQPLSQLFRPQAVPPPAPADPLTALDSAAPESLVATALGDGDSALRAAAIGKLPDGEPLRRLAGLAGDGTGSLPRDLARIARQRLVTLVDAGTIDIAVLGAAAAHPPALLEVAALSADPAHLTRALAAIDPGRLPSLVIDGSSSRVRQLAAQRIDDPAELGRLLKELRGKDKGVYRIIQQKCAALHAAEERRLQREHAISALCAALERQSLESCNTHYPQRLAQLEARWQAVETQAPPNAKERAGQAIERCREVIAAHALRAADEAAERAARNSRLAALQAAEDEAHAREAEEVRQRESAAALAASAAAQARAAEQALHDEKLAADALALRRLGGLVSGARRAVEEGNSGRAAGLRRAIAEKLSAAPALPAQLGGQLLKLDARLEELKGWKDFAAAPKRAELIRDMTALIGSAEEPRKLAARIQQVQEDWKTLSKGIAGDSGEDWQRFRQASEQAYQPCRDHFAAQAEQRRVNLAQRKAIVERLLAFGAANADEPLDGRAFAAVLREAPQEWRRHFPVERAAGRAVEEAYEACLGGLQQRLDAWYAGNMEEKKTLIERARHLGRQGEGAEAMEGVKRLQLRWKDIGSAPRDQEQVLWQEFRELCTAVFQKRERAASDYTALLAANKATAAALCERVEAFAAANGAALLEGAAQAAQWRAEFDAVGEMPRTDARSLGARFARAFDQVRSRIAQQQARDKENCFVNLLEAARRIHAYARETALHGAPAEAATLKHAAEAFIAGVRQWPKGGARALEDAWHNADAAAAGPAITADDDVALRLLCIRSEILADLPTPPEDHALRRGHQLQRLTQRMGQGVGADADDLDDLALQWVRATAATAASYEPLLDRFARCRST